jgi:ubiquinone/menaquinone biosynthesis C-methylase UbiE
MANTDTTTRPDYGLDAPVLVRTFFLAGVGALLLLLPAAFGVLPGRLWGFLLAALPLVCATYLLGMGCLLLYFSRVSKLRESDQLLDLISLSGREHILDVGCGRGLMLVGAAKRLRDGKAFGIDLWQAEDQADNRPDVTLNNARLEGVAARIEVQTADMRRLPFPDQSFDAVVSHWAVHNLRNAKERARALAEMHRVLKPAGQVVLADIEHHAEYAAGFARLGFTDIQHVGASWQTTFLSALLFGRFCPTAVFARKSVTQSISK